MCKPFAVLESSFILVHPCEPKVRMQLAVETLLTEAKSRVVAAELKVYVSVVGLGLGVRRSSLHRTPGGTGTPSSQVTSSTGHTLQVDRRRGLTGYAGPRPATVVHFSKSSLQDPFP